MPSKREFDLCIHCEKALPANTDACKRCALPHQLFIPNDGICEECKLSQPPLDLAHAAFVFSPLVKSMLHRIKFQQGTIDSYLLTHLLAEQLSQLYANRPLPQVILPVPLALPRLIRRGFNQSAFIARQLGKALLIPVNYTLLERNLHTRPQTGLGRAARKTALNKAFKVSGNAPYTHVVLVDDVMTTGATLHAQALCLHRAGVKSVDAWVLARTPKQKA